MPTPPPPCGVAILHTGDVGRIEADGSLMITDRMKDVIKSGGEWISSLTLESISSAVDGVAEVAAMAFPTRNGVTAALAGGGDGGRRCRAPAGRHHRRARG